MMVGSAGGSGPRGNNGSPAPAAPGRGVRIVRIDAGSLAYRSGLRRGDVILGVNRVAIGAMGDFSNVASVTDPSQGVLFDVFRSGARHFLTIEPTVPAGG
jgi:S1-C subfamily serine protease